MKRRALLCLVLLVSALPRASREAPSQAPSEEAILDYLNQAITWYRQQSAQAQLATEPAETVFVGANRQIAREVLGLAFEFARAAVALQPELKARSPQPDVADATGQHLNEQVLTRMLDDATKRLRRAQAEVDALQRRMNAATDRRRAALAQRLAEARSELHLAQARHETVKTFLDFLRQEGGGSSASGLLGQIEELERSVPEARAREAATAPAAVVAPQGGARAAPSGILSLAADLFSLRRKLRALRGGTALTDRLHGKADELRSPLLDDLRETLRRGDELAQLPDDVSSQALQQRSREIDQLTSHFRNVSAAVLPLGKQAVLLDTYRANLNEWSSLVDGEYDSELRGLLLHLGLVVLAVVAIFAASNFWRQATFRYVHDLRRRQQSLVVRRIIVAVAVVLVIGFSLMTEFGSLATFAGFITAGLAVALQNVILSVAAYFFLIGKYGIRVGDRVQISGVTGDVMDVGLVHLQLMEVRPDGLPTGRVVVFSNAVLFQPTANLFKQIPGSNFTWHQVTLTLSPDTDYRYAEKRLMDAVENVYLEYRDRIARQHQEMSQNLSISVSEPRPESQLRLTEAGLEMTVRFPVPLEHAATIDDRVTRALLEAIDREPRIKLVGSRTPTIQAAPEPASA